MFILTALTEYAVQKVLNYYGHDRFPCHGNTSCGIHNIPLMSSMRKFLSTSHNKVLHACSMLVSCGRRRFVTVVTCTGGVRQQVLEARKRCRVMPPSLWSAHLSISTARFLLKETSNSKNNLLAPHTFLCDFE